MTPNQLPTHTQYGAAALLFCLCFSLCGCASYRTLPLATTGSLRESPRELDRISLDPVRPADGPFAMDDIVRLALENNRDLLAARVSHQVGQAQLLQASLLSNPQITGNYAELLGGPGTIASWGGGISQDIKALIVYSSQKASARFDAKSIDADLLWQEWQVVNKARLLYVDIVTGDRQLALLDRSRELFTDRYGRDRNALSGGHVDLTAVAPDLSALSDVTRQCDELVRLQASRRHDLDALLGLDPAAFMKLVEAVDLPQISSAEYEDALANLAERRPDLVALRLGYDSEEEKLRGAVLAQFPAFVLGGTYGSDTSHVRTFGPQITFDLPIFNRGQGAIAVETATRQRLHDEFRARLDGALGEVRAMRAETEGIERQLTALRATLAETAEIASHADAAYAAGETDERTYVDLEMTNIGKLQELASLEQLLWEQRVAIITLVGAGMPAVSLPPQPKE